MIHPLTPGSVGATIRQKKKTIQTPSRACTHKRAATAGSKRAL
jgi:hypothetical protein